MTFDAFGRVVVVCNTDSRQLDLALPVATTNDLSGFTDTIKNVFRESKTQILVVYQIHSASRYVVLKDKKEFTA